MSQEKIREVLNAVDCIYEPKMLIELIRWQQGHLASARQALQHAIPFIRDCCDDEDPEAQRYAIATESEVSNVIKAIEIVHLENALSGSPDLT